MINKSTVLIVEDDRILRRILETKIRNNGYQVYSSGDGAEGYDLILKERPQVVITDIQMPIMDGKSLCEKTCELKKKNPFLTIVITSLVSEDHSWIDEMDETELMLKPLDFRKLINRVDQYLRGA